jgi:uncharacterized membrane protein
MSSGSGSTTAHHLLVATFGDEERASRALLGLLAAVGHDAIGMSAVVVRRHDGKVRFAETKDRTGGQGAIAGAGVGAMAALVGVLFTPLALLSAPIGAVIGGLVGTLRDTGYDDHDLVALGHDLTPGQSALIVDLGDDLLDTARREFEEAGASRVVTAAVDADLAAILDAAAGDLELGRDET